MFINYFTSVLLTIILHLGGMTTNHNYDLTKISVEVSSISNLDESQTIVTPIHNGKDTAHHNFDEGVDTEDKKDILETNLSVLYISFTHTLIEVNPNLLYKKGSITPNTPLHVLNQSFLI